MRKFALGTAQFGLTYGIANTSGKVGENAVAEILRRAAVAGVDTLDSAVAYGNSEEVLGRVGAQLGNWKIVSKLPALPEATPDISQWIRSQLHGSLNRLGVAQLDALLLHRPSDLTGPRGGEYLSALREREIAERAGALGISIYDPTELDQIWPVWKPQIVQAPLNVLDRRLLASGWLARLAENGVRVHARSVFLQGLLLMPAEQRPAWFQPWAELLDRWFAWCASNSVSPQRAALSFVDKHADVERYVVGVDSVRQVEELLSLDLENCPRIPEEFSCNDRDLVEPSRWKLQ